MIPIGEPVCVEPEATAMTEPMYQVGVEQKLLELSERLEYEVDQYGVLAVERAEAESEYKRQ